MSDHFPSPRAVAEPAIDITDLYVFPSPSRSGHLVLVMCVFPNAGPGALFSDAVDYRFRVRPVTISATPAGSLFQLGADEYDITFTFSAPVTTDRRGQLVQEGTCILPGGAAVSFRVNHEDGLDAPGARVFGGVRLDPNFVNVPWYIETLASRHLTIASGTNSADGWNVLSIIVELDVSTILGDAMGSLFAVVGETITAGKFPMRLERFGRVEVKNQLLTEYGVDTVNSDLDLRELYNQEDPFELAPDISAPTAPG